MDTLKNFLIGLIAILLSPIVFIFAVFAWRFLLGFGSVALVLAIGVLVLVLVFYIMVLIGFIIRKIFSSAFKSDS